MACSGVEGSGLVIEPLAAHILGNKLDRRPRRRSPDTEGMEQLVAYIVKSKGQETSAGHLPMSQTVPIPFNTSLLSSHGPASLILCSLEQEHS